MLVANRVLGRRRQRHGWRRRPPRPHNRSRVHRPGPYSPFSPTRICDTRPGNPSGLSGPGAQCDGIFNSGSTISAGGTLTLNVAGSFGIPADASAVVLNVTVVKPSAAGYLTVYPTAATQPTASNLNFTAGEVVPNLVEVGAGSSGQVSIYSSSRSDVVVDVEGYVDSTASGGTGAGLYNALSPARICDTRSGNPSGLTGGAAQCTNGTAGERLGAGGTLSVQVTGNDTIPAGATAAVLNVTSVNPCGRRLPHCLSPRRQPTWVIECQLHRRPDECQPGHRAPVIEWQGLHLFLGCLRRGGRRFGLLLGGRGHRGPVHRRAGPGAHL